MEVAVFSAFNLATLFDTAPYALAIRRRLAKASQALRLRPEASFPAALGAAGYRALTRLWQNPRVQERMPFEEVFAASAARLPAATDVVVAHDTTDFVFHAEGERVGLERIDDGRVRFRGHVSLAVLADGARVVVGPLAFEPIARTAPVAKGQSAKQRYDAPDKESLRWWRGIDAAEAHAVGTGAQLIHVMDREADDFALLWDLVVKGRRFVQRPRLSRVLAASPPHAPAARKVDQALGEGLVTLATREVAIARRSGRDSPGPAARKRFPARAARLAQLEVRATALALARPSNAPASLPASLTLNVVHVVEPNPPSGEAAVDWVLMTSEPIATAEQVLRVVDLYRRRWLVEEFFKALKTGCAYERRQLESLPALLIALALFLPIATDLLNLRVAAERDAPVAASLVLDEAQRAVLAAEAKCVPEALDAAEALRQVARLGGHLSHNGRPGWQVLWRGWQRVCERAVGWRAARDTLRQRKRKT